LFVARVVPSSWRDAALGGPHSVAPDIGGGNRKRLRSAEAASGNREAGIRATQNPPPNAESRRPHSRRPPSRHSNRHRPMLLRSCSAHGVGGGNGSVQPQTRHRTPNPDDRIPDHRHLATATATARCRCARAAPTVSAGQTEAVAVVGNGKSQGPGTFVAPLGATAALRGRCESTLASCTRML